MEQANPSASEYMHIHIYFIHINVAQTNTTLMLLLSSSTFVPFIPTKVKSSHIHIINHSAHRGMA